MKKLKIMAFLGLISPLLGFQKVDVNEASAEQIALLPSVGEQLAKEMITYRKNKHGIKSAADLALVPGLTSKKLEHIKPPVVFGSSKAKTELKKLVLLHSLPVKSIISYAELERAVLKEAALEKGLEEDLRERARRSAWLPRLGLAFELERDLDTSEKSLRNKPDAIHKRGGLDFGFGIRATFDLPELMFNKAELDIAGLEQRRFEKREKITEKLHALYFRYQRLYDEGQEPQEQENIARIKRTLEEIAASLDSLSNGAFSGYQGEGS